MDKVEESHVRRALGTLDRLSDALCEAAHACMDVGKVGDDTGMQNGMARVKRAISQARDERSEVEETLESLLPREVDHDDDLEAAREAFMEAHS